MITLQVKTASGEIMDFRVEELISIDGNPYRQADETEYLSAQISELKGRVTTIERAIFRPIENGSDANG